MGVCGGRRARAEKPEVDSACQRSGLGAGVLKREVACGAGVPRRLRVLRGAGIWRRRVSGEKGCPWGRDSQDGDSGVEGAAGASVLEKRGPQRRLWGSQESETT